MEAGATFTPNGKKLTLTGGTHQKVKGDWTFHSLAIGKDNNTDVVTIDGSLRVTNRLQITRGKVLSAGGDFADVDLEADGALELTTPHAIRGHFTINGNLMTKGHQVTFNGGKPQNLALHVPTTFDDLTVDTGTTLVKTVADDNATINGVLTNNGIIRKTQSVSGPGAHTFGLAGRFNGAALLTNVTTPGGLSALQVDRIDGNHPNRTGTDGGSGVGGGRYWTISPTGSGYTVDLTLPHNISPHSNAKACRYTGGGWDCVRISSTATTVTRLGVTGFSDWTVGDNVGPSAITLNSFGAQGGGTPLLAGMALLGLLLVTGMVVVRRKRA